MLLEHLDFVFNKFREMKMPPSLGVCPSKGWVTGS